MKIPKQRFLFLFNQLPEHLKAKYRAMIKAALAERGVVS